MAKILIVDDHPSNRDFLVTLLSYRHHQLLQAADGEEALALARAERPDLVITDLLMPKVDGYEFLRLIRNDPTLRTTRVIFYSAAYQRWETEALDEAGQVARHLEKPSPPEEILQAVDEVLGATPSPAPIVAPEEFDRAHLRLITNKLARKVQALEETQAQLRRQAEALAQSQARMDGIISSAMDAIVSINAEQRIVLFNPAAEKLFGVPAREAIGQNLERLIPQHLRSAHAQHVQDFGRTGTTSRKMGALGTVTGVRANGEEFPIEASISQVELQGEKLFTVILRDITHRVKAEQALQASEAAAHRHLAELENIYQRTPIGLGFLDTNLRYVAVNDLLAEFNGLAAQEHLGRTVREVLPAQANHLEQVLRHVLETNTPAADIEVSGATRKEPGRTRFWLASYYPVKNETVRGLNAVVVDITERKHAEEALRQARDELAQANAELERRVEERTSQLVEANTNLQTFANSAAHDLRSPLRAITNFSAMALEEYGPKLDEMGRSFLDRIRTSADQMTRLLSDLLDYSRMNQAELRLEKVSLRSAAQEALGLVETDIQAKHAVVTVAEPLPDVIGHPATVVLIITNLVSNALKFMAPGVQPQIRIRAESVQTQKAAGAFPAPTGSTSPLVRLWVEDNGVGIDQQGQAKLFNAFQRLHGKQAYPGTGLGLAIVRKGAERLGGRVGVESEPGKGSRFWIELPKAAEGASVVKLENAA